MVPVLTYDRWVFSSELPTTQSNGHSIYNPSLSTTSKQLPGYTWAIRYGDGSGASGDVYTDTVKVGTTTVVNQAVELASNISAQFQRDVDNDGLLGLAFDPINTGKLTAYVGHHTQLTHDSETDQAKDFLQQRQGILVGPALHCQPQEGKAWFVHLWLRGCRSIYWLRLLHSRQFYERLLGVHKQRLRCRQWRLQVILH